MDLLKGFHHDDRAQYYQRYCTKRGFHDSHVHDRRVLHDLPQWERIRGDCEGRHPAGCCGRPFGLAAVFAAGYSASTGPNPPTAQCGGDSSERSRQQVHFEHPQGCHCALRAGKRERVDLDNVLDPRRSRSRRFLKFEGDDFCASRSVLTDVRRIRRNGCERRDLNVSPCGVLPRLAGHYRHHRDSIWGSPSLGVPHCWPSRPVDRDFDEFWRRSGARRAS
jgi:hypothetical protein